MFNVNQVQTILNDSPSPYATDRTTKVTVEIAGKQYNRISNYSYDSDVLQLGDPCAVTIPDPNARYGDESIVGSIALGDPFKLFMADPDVDNGARKLKLTGIVTDIQDTSEESSGTQITVSAADLGWHLCNNDAPLWKRFLNQTYQGLFNLLVDPTWGFAGFRAENDTNIRLKKGGNYQRAVANISNLDQMPIFQIEPGDKPADKFIEYARLAGRLVNVSGDGYLQLFKPRYDTPVSGKFYLYRENNPQRAKNNIQRARRRRSINGIWTQAICVGSPVIATTLDPNARDPHDPNVNSFRGFFSPDVSPLHFNRLTSFVDPDVVTTRAQADQRAKWKIQRGLFDSWSYAFTVFGHAQNGSFFEPDTMCEIHDEMRGMDGRYYISAVRYNRDEHSGTTTTLTVHKPDLLAA